MGVLGSDTNANTMCLIGVFDYNLLGFQIEIETTRHDLQKYTEFLKGICHGRNAVISHGPYTDISGK